jgi:hypothetical protein
MMLLSVLEPRNSFGSYTRMSVCNNVLVKPLSCLSRLGLAIDFGSGLIKDVAGLDGELLLPMA